MKTGTAPGGMHWAEVFDAQDALNPGTFQTGTFQKIFYHTGEDFSAMRQAEKWLHLLGYSIGSVCFNEPRAIHKGEHIIGKWRNLSFEARKSLDGVMMASSFDFRNGNVVVCLRDGIGVVDDEKK